MDERRQPQSPETTAPQPDHRPGRPAGVVASGWLAAYPTAAAGNQRHLTGALATSVVAHIGLAVLIILIIAFQPEREVREPPPIEYDLVYLQSPGPGGGGGGSPEPAPPAEKIEIPTPEEPEPLPIVPPEPVPETPPVPVLTAPVTTNAEVPRWQGETSISITPYSGGGRGRGLGPGSGDGVGPGEGGGFGGGAFQLGAGINNPVLVREVKPNYTSEAMRQKIQGWVYLDAVVRPDGTVDEVKIVRSLDRQFGLDDEAMRAARQWLFRPATNREGEPVAVIIRMELEFRLH